MINLILSLTFAIMTIGYLSVLIYALKHKDFLKSLLIVAIPFYVFYYIMKLPEIRFKKMVAIACIGCFWIFFFAGILKIVFTPPV